MFHAIIIFSVADIPGLLKGAHANYGLGHSFLRHIERCHYLVYVLDGAIELLEQVTILNEELLLYNPLLLPKVKLVIVNKLDLEGTDGRVRGLMSNIELPIVPISSLYHWNITELKHILYNLYINIKSSEFNEKS